MVGGYVYLPEVYSEVIGVALSTTSSGVTPVQPGIYDKVKRLHDSGKPTFIDKIFFELGPDGIFFISPILVNLTIAPDGDGISYGFGIDLYGEKITIITRSNDTIKYQIGG